MKKKTPPPSESAVFSDARVPPPASPRLRAIARELVEEQDRLLVKMEEMIHGIADYRSIRDEGFWSEVRQILRINIPLFFEAILDGRPASEAEISAARHFARRRVHQGISLRGHLTAYRNGMWILWEALVDRACDRGIEDQRELLLRAAWAFRHLDVMSTAVTEGYLAEQEGRARERDRLLRHFLDEVIDGGPASPEDLEERASRLGVDTQTPASVAVLAPATQRAGVSPGLVASLASLASQVAVTLAEAVGRPVDEIVMVERNRVFVLLVPGALDEASRDDLLGGINQGLGSSSTPETVVQVGISAPATGIAGIRQGFREAARAIEIGTLVEPKGRVFFYDDLVLQDVFDLGGRAGERLVRQSLGLLLERGAAGVRYITTLEAYFAAGSNLKVAAAHLGIHPNTLAYRMRQIHQISGLNLDDPEQRLRTEVALRLLAFERKRHEARKSHDSTAG